MPRLCLKDAWKETPAERNLANQTQAEYRNIAHSDRRVVSLSKKHLGLLSKSTDNTLEAVAPSRRDRKIVYCRIKSTNFVLVSDKKSISACIKAMPDTISRVKFYVRTVAIINVYPEMEWKKKRCK